MGAQVRVPGALRRWWVSANRHARELCARERPEERQAASDKHHDRRATRQRRQFPGLATGRVGCKEGAPIISRRMVLADSLAGRLARRLAVRLGEWRDGWLPAGSLADCRLVAG